MKFIGALCDEVRRSDDVMTQYIRSIYDQGGDYLYMIDHNPDGWVQDVADECLAHRIGFVLGITLNPTTEIGKRKLNDAMAITEDIALGTRCGEWSGSAASARQFVFYEEQFGYRWWVPITVGMLVEDLANRGGAVMEAISQRPCLSLCAYVVSGYLFRDPYVPHQGERSLKLQKEGHPAKYTKLSGVNLNRHFGLTISKWRNYISKYNILTGAGGQLGLDVGVASYAEALGFKGLVIGMPFDLRETKKVPVDMMEPPQYPEAMGGEYDIRPTIEMIKGLA